MNGEAKLLSHVPLWNEETYSSYMILVKKMLDLLNRLVAK
ncbi:hypothetical protein KR51_00013140 [Rubidibacter lacunae KORDI 51-2]|uniref:Uncharacterized protein n=1 Tax=Rubidibacter lacunae KORDI 51-2 TaxID=582515 RepID=U5DBS6_9CHRO|nr:hypothetical protein KR51_00013140 [Rubidibacter lacunae KORDI 51-2]